MEFQYTHIRLEIDEQMTAMEKEITLIVAINIIRGRLVIELKNFPFDVFYVRFIQEKLKKNFHQKMSLDSELTKFIAR